MYLCGHNTAADERIWSVNWFSVLNNLYRRQKRISHVDFDPKETKEHHLQCWKGEDLNSKINQQKQTSNRFVSAYKKGISLSLFYFECTMNKLNRNELDILWVEHEQMFVVFFFFFVSNKLMFIQYLNTIYAWVLYACLHDEWCEHRVILGWILMGVLFAWVYGLETRWWWILCTVHRLIGKAQTQPASSIQWLNSNSSERLYEKNVSINLPNDLEFVRECILLDKMSWWSSGDLNYLLNHFEAAW